ncbi:hypothetical protein [Kribbella sp. CA-293567]|uniref:hypothetical protein n=1 Tax=Kribbella sp. CA-293567 TaxID=3002436 RepID=UPI0022DDB332|nr:hypothetical protein [Kribbella sp. CA-293567]WBQ08490.1 hypothetical protein OX958_17140 [Kribbella sp. CA-293567]
MRRQLVPTITTFAAVTGVVAFTLVASAPVGNAAARASSAYAVSAEGQVPVAKTPYTESLDGKRHSSSALELPKNPLLSVRAGTVTAGNDAASVELFDLVVGPDILNQVKLPPDLKKSCDTLPPTGADDLPIPKLPLPELGIPLPDLSTVDLPVKNLPDLCKLLLTPPSSLLGIESVTVWCTGNTGGVDIGALTLLGQRIAVPTVKQGASIPAAPLATITVNNQTNHSDGAFTITGLTINLGGTQVIRLASATCAKPAAKATPKPTQPRPTFPVQAPNEAPAAPVPTPVKTHHPVTG